MNDRFKKYKSIGSSTSGGARIWGMCSKFVKLRLTKHLYFKEYFIFIF